MFIRRLLLAALAVMLTALLISCSNKTATNSVDDKADKDQLTDNSTFTAQIDGVEFDGDFWAYATNLDDKVPRVQTRTAGVFDGDTLAIFIDILNPEVGKTRALASPGGVACFIDGVMYVSNLATPSGEVKITSMSEDRLVGTFSATVYASPSDSLVISDGAFDLEMSLQLML
jgi:hypothetical protein